MKKSKMNTSRSWGQVERAKLGDDGDAFAVGVRSNERCPVVSTFS
jgi:hypothetical protein